MERKEQNDLEDKRNIDLSLGAIAQNWIQNFLKQIAERLEKMEEGSILKWKDGKYEIDTSKEINDRIEQKMKDVWK